MTKEKRIAVKEMHKIENKTDAVITKTNSVIWKPTVWDNVFSRLIECCPQRYN